MILLSLVIFFAFVWTFRRQGNLPPGPKGLPIVGSLFSLSTHPYKDFLEWGQVYGDVMSVRLGTELVVVLNSFDAIKAAFVKQGAKFSSRPTNSTTGQLFQQKGVVDAPSPSWQALRKYTLRSLHEFGMGKALSEVRILDECDFVVKQLNNHIDSSIDLRQLIPSAISNVMCIMLFGHRFDYDDGDFKEMLRLSDALLKDLLASNFLTFIPILWHFPLPIKRNLIKNWHEFRDYMDKKIEEHKIKIQKQTGDDCILDRYLLKGKEIEERKIQDPSLSCLSDFDHLRVTWVELFVAGTDAVANTLLWAIIYLALNPDIQEKCIEDIKEGIGMDKTPSYADKSKLPFMEATTLESHRIASVVPLVDPHMTSEATTLNGYYIPKNTVVFANTWAVHMDKTEWENPETFNPGRFLDEDGNIVKMKRNRIMPFSIGPRGCQGKELANTEVFLFLTSLLQRFEFKIPEGDTPSMEGTLGSVRMPPPYKVIIRTRDTS
ncbi:cytochrome P450 2U1-like [Glandiceps talaboti]